MNKRMFMNLLLFSSLLQHNGSFYPHYNNYKLPELSKEELDRLVQKRLKDREESCKLNKISKKMKAKLYVCSSKRKVVNFIQKHIEGGGNYER